MKLLPSIALVSLTILLLPLWPWSREWGYELAAMSGVIAATVVLFTLAFV